MKGKKMLVFLLVWLAGMVNAQDVWKYIITYNGLKACVVYSIAFSSEGTVFIGAGNDNRASWKDSANGVIRIEGDIESDFTYNTHFAKTVLKEKNIYGIVFDDERRILAGSDSAIYVSSDNGDHWTILNNTPVFEKWYDTSNKVFRTISDMVYTHNTLWVGDGKYVYNYTESGGWKTILEAEGKKSFTPTPEGMYVGVYSKGLYFRKWIENKWQYTDMDSVFPGLDGANFIQDVAFSRKDNSLWVIATKKDEFHRGGVFRFTGLKKWDYISRSGLPLEIIAELFTVVAVDSNGAVWFGITGDNADGAFKWDGKWHRYYDELKASGINCIAIDAQNRKWFGHNGGWISVLTERTGVEDNSAHIPNQLALYQNYPNPFNAETTISYQLARPGKVKLVIYDLLGKKVAILVNEFQEPGRHSVTFNANALSSGVYLYRLQAGKYIETRKMAFAK